MKKYFEVAKVLFKSQLAFRFDIAFNMLFTVTKILFAYIVWGAVFGENEYVAGFTLNSMLTYYVVSSFLSGLDISEGVSWEISSRIRNGTFSKYLVIPVWPEGYFHAQNYGAAAMYMIFNLFAAVVWVFLFRFSFTVTTDLCLLTQAALMVVLGLVFMVQFSFFLGILTFKFGDISAFLMVKGNLVAFATGTMVPLTLLPAGVVSVMRFLPFYYVTYLPSMLIIGRNKEEAGLGLLTLGLWALVFFAINNIAFNRLRKKYDGVGI